MPLYEFACKCGHTGSDFFSMKDVPNKLACPACKKKSFVRVFSLPSYVKTSKTFKTVGQQMEQNDKKFGKELKQKMVEAERARVRGATQKGTFTGKLGKGMKENTSGSDEIPPWRDGSMGTHILEKPLDVSKLDTPEKTETYIETGKLP